MKNLIACIVVMAVVSCNSTQKRKAPKMAGAYLMTTQVLNDGTSEKKYTTLKQLKIYTDDGMMYTQVNPADSVSSFGVGFYTADTGTVIENVIYRAKDTMNNSSPVSYKLNIMQTNDGYEQVIPELKLDSVTYKLTEMYQTAGTKATSPLDGLWKLTSSYWIKGKDTSKDQRVQYKAYYQGNFMFGHTYKDSLNKSHTGIGFGTFETINNNNIKETDLNSTYNIIAGQSFDVDIEMSDKDHYKQIITNSNGTKGVEEYERLKK